ncbi:23622_t:CDS:2, partial [Racocetra persica]
MLYQQNIVKEENIPLENQAPTDQSNLIINDYRIKYFFIIFYYKYKSDSLFEDSSQASCFYTLIEESDQEGYSPAKYSNKKSQKSIKSQS